MSVLKAHIIASHTPSAAAVAAAVVEVRHTIDTGSFTRQGGLESNGDSSSINKDLYREVRRYLGLI